MSATAEQLLDDGWDSIRANGEVFTRLSGVVVPYSHEYTDVGMMGERFVPGSFTRSIVEAAGKIPLLVFHSRTSLPIGVSDPAGWDETPTGLRASFTLLHTTVAQETALVARDTGALGLSVGFVPEQTTWEYPRVWDPDNGVDGLDKATRHRARLVEVSAVATPAYARARIDDVVAESLDGSSRSEVARYRAYLRDHHHLVRSGLTPPPTTIRR